MPCVRSRTGTLEKAGALRPLLYEPKAPQTGADCSVLTAHLGAALGNTLPPDCSFFSVVLADVGKNGGEITFPSTFFSPIVKILESRLHLQKIKASKSGGLRKVSKGSCSAEKGCGSPALMCSLEPLCHQVTLFWLGLGCQLKTPLRDKP